MKIASNVYLIGFAITICVVVNTASAYSSVHSKPRATRGFKTAALSTARGFGKRDGYYQSSDPVSDAFDDARRGYFSDTYKKQMESDSFPVEWFAEELAGNPRLARLIVRRFIDQNQDGELSSDELFRNSGY